MANLPLTRTFKVTLTSQEMRGLLVLANQANIDLDHIVQRLIQQAIIDHFQAVKKHL